MSVITKVHKSQNEFTHSEISLPGGAAPTTTWYEDPSLGSYSKRRKKENVDSWSVGGDMAKKEINMCQKHPVHQQAIRALIDEILRFPLTWARAKPGGKGGGATIHWATMAKSGALPALEPVVPSWCSRFVHDAVESIAAVGYFAYYAATFSTGTGLIVQPPQDYVLRATERQPQWTPHMMYQHVPTIPAKKLFLVVLHPPRKNSIRSPAAQTLEDTLRYNQLQNNFMERDTLNSEHTVYTVISSDLKNQNGSTRQWFRSATADEAAGVRPAVDTDFKRLIERRADTVRQLQEHTAQERARLKRNTMKEPLGSQKSLKSLMGKVEDDPQKHFEHVITDGREYTQAHQLQSLTDGKEELDRIYTNIMLAYNVPPQIFGKNINTERHAASNRLTESAVQIFARYAKSIRDLLQPHLASATKLVDRKSYVAFRPVVDFGVLQQLAPALKPSFITSTLFATYGIAPHHIKTNEIADVVAGYPPEHLRQTQQEAQPKKEKGKSQTTTNSKAGSDPAKVNRKEDVS